MEPGWEVKYAAREKVYDITFGGGAGLLFGAGDAAIVIGPAKYDTCLNETGWDNSVHPDDLTPGTNICVRTSERRFAYITSIKKIPRDANRRAQIDVIVWPPQREE
jgi:hypothetical protein